MSKLKHPFFLNVGAIVISIKPEADGKRIRPHRFKNVLFHGQNAFSCVNLFFFPLKPCIYFLSLSAVAPLALGTTRDRLFPPPVAQPLQSRQSDR